MLCGWHTHTDIPLTGVPTSMRGGESVDILIHIAPLFPVAKNLGRGVLEHSGEGWLLKIQGVADFEVIRGHEIRVWPIAGYAKGNREFSFRTGVGNFVSSAGGVAPPR